MMDDGIIKAVAALCVTIFGTVSMIWGTFEIVYFFTGIDTLSSLAAFLMGLLLLAALVEDRA